MGTKRRLFDAEFEAEAVGLVRDAALRRAVAQLWGAKLALADVG